MGSFFQSLQVNRFNSKLKGFSSLKLRHIITTILVFSLTQFGCGPDPVLTPAQPEFELRTANIKILNYCPNKPQGTATAPTPPTGSGTVSSSLYTYKDIFAFNSSVYKMNDAFLMDTDRDGLDDEIEKEYKNYLKYSLDFKNRDSNSDGFSDLIMYKMKFDQNKQAALARQCTLNQDSDDDRDGLKNCEEELLGTFPDRADSDTDGIPDGLEFRFGTNLLQFDSDLDPDLDGLSNLEEIKQHTPHLSTNTDLMAKYATKYNIFSFTDTDGYQCYNITAKDIPLLDVDNGNLVDITITESRWTSQYNEELRIRTVKVLVPSKFPEDGQVIVDGVYDQCYGGIPSDTLCNLRLVVVPVQTDEREVQ